MHIILNFVKQYFIFMLLLFVFSYLVPKENYRRYFNFFISVMMVAALLFPLLQISEKEVAAQTKARLEEIEEKIGDTQYYQKGENIFEQFLSDEGMAETENKEPDENGFSYYDTHRSSGADRHDSHRNERNIWKKQAYREQKQ